MEAAGRSGSRARGRTSRPLVLPVAVWRWRAAGVVGVLLYVAQDVGGGGGLRWEWLANLQSVDVFK